MRRVLAPIIHPTICKRHCHTEHYQVPHIHPVEVSNVTNRMFHHYHQVEMMQQNSCHDFHQHYMCRRP
ncbi:MULTISPECIES: CotD family spore coat protein [Jeotgalibacillus]|uniref:CotD family spore coat protein n=1 Tax=Jeotgalibacillus TaxID=157226 RepID=UPI00141BBEBA|nr:MULTISPECIES: CotD family spore coat protein [Jeotgalibacillus]